MIELKNSGLPIYLKENDELMAISVPLTLGGFSHKTVGQMKGLFADETDLAPEEIVYDVYRSLIYPADKPILDEWKFQYDITIVRSGLLNGECKKTSGHYHGYNPQRTYTYGEVYEVIKGTALYVLQRADNFEAMPEELNIDDVILAVVKEGETIIVPPDYGHCSINIGEGPLVFSNLAYSPCKVHYDAVKHHQGMSFYARKEGGKLRVTPNPNYAQKIAPKFARVRENEALGIKFGLPVYQSFLKNPEAFRFLSEPDAWFGEIMGMLDKKNTLEEVL
ncbi:glucose-6-phosphate isomerase family protein [Bacillota bacterium Meth-B3]